MRSAALITLALVAFAAPLARADGDLVTKRSAHSVAVTLDRLEAAREAGAAVVARIDHAAGAAKIGQTLRPTAVLFFASPRLGTPLMQARQTMGIDLPLKALAWEDDRGQVWLSYPRAPGPGQPPRAAPGLRGADEAGPGAPDGPGDGALNGGGSSIAVASVA